MSQVKVKVQVPKLVAGKRIYKELTVSVDLLQMRRDHDDVPVSSALTLDDIATFAGAQIQTEVDKVQYMGNWIVTDWV